MYKKKKIFLKYINLRSFKGDPENNLTLYAFHTIYEIPQTLEVSSIKSFKVFHKRLAIEVVCFVGNHEIWFHFIVCFNQYDTYEGLF